MNEPSNIIGKFASNKALQAATQAAQAFPDPMVSGGATIGGALLNYVAQSYQSDQQDALNEYLHQLDLRTQHLDDKKIDETFLYSKDGRRLIARIMRLVYRDSRKEKIIAASHLTTKLITSNRLSVDEKELFVETLDSLNVLQLSILQYVTIVMWQRTQNPHNGFDIGKVAKHYGDKGVKLHLLHQSVKSLESLGLVSENTAMVKDVDRTHFISDYGVEFIQFCTDLRKETISSQVLEQL